MDIKIPTVDFSISNISNGYLLTYNDTTGKQWTRFYDRREDLGTAVLLVLREHWGA